MGYDDTFNVDSWQVIAAINWWHNQILTNMSHINLFEKLKGIRLSSPLSSPSKLTPSYDDVVQENQQLRREMERLFQQLSCRDGHGSIDQMTDISSYKNRIVLQQLKEKELVTTKLKGDLQVLDNHNKSLVSTIKTLSDSIAGKDNKLHDMEAELLQVLPMRMEISRLEKSLSENLSVIREGIVTRGNLERDNEAKTSQLLLLQYEYEELQVQVRKCQGTLSQCCDGILEILSELQAMNTSLNERIIELEKLTLAMEREHYKKEVDLQEASRRIIASERLFSELRNDLDCRASPKNIETTASETQVNLTSENRQLAEDQCIPCFFSRSIYFHKLK